jgi:hypothetical protein
VDCGNRQQGAIFSSFCRYLREGSELPHEQNKTSKSNRTCPWWIKKGVCKMCFSHPALTSSIKVLHIDSKFFKMQTSIITAIRESNIEERTKIFHSTSPRERIFVGYFFFETFLKAIWNFVDFTNFLIDYRWYLQIQWINFDAR